MSDERHDEIAARLRAEAGARAPERLRADVMLQVRAEPRPRRIRPRPRRSWRPLGAVAAAACVLAALVIGLGHGASSSPEAALTANGGSVAGGGATKSALHASAGATTEPAAAPQATRDNSLATASHRALFYQAATLPPGLGRALESLILERGRGSH